MRLRERVTLFCALCLAAAWPSAAQAWTAEGLNAPLVGVADTASPDLASDRSGYPVPVIKRFVVNGSDCDGDSCTVEAFRPFELVVKTEEVVDVVWWDADGDGASDAVSYPAKRKSRILSRGLRPGEYHPRATVVRQGVEVTVEAERRLIVTGEAVDINLPTVDGALVGCCTARIRWSGGSGFSHRVHVETMDGEWISGELLAARPEVGVLRVSKPIASAKLEVLEGPGREFMEVPLAQTLPIAEQDFDIGIGPFEVENLLDVWQPYEEGRALHFSLESQDRALLVPAEVNGTPLNRYLSFRLDTTSVTFSSGSSPAVEILRLFDTDKDREDLLPVLTLRIERVNGELRLQVLRLGLGSSAVIRERSLPLTGIAWISVEFGKEAGGLRWDSVTVNGERLMLKRGAQPFSGDGVSVELGVLDPAHGWQGAFVVDDVQLFEF